MAEIALRVRTHFPGVYITLISIVVALAMENLVSELRGLRGSGSLLDTAIVWSQAFAVFAVVVTVWTGSSLGALTLRWLPRIFDLAGPLVLLVLINLGIAAIGAEAPHRFLYVAAAGSFLGFLTIRSLNTRAAQSRENRELLGVFGPGQWRVHAALGAFSLLAAALVQAGTLSGGGALFATLLFGICQAGCSLLHFRAFERAWAAPV